jgi:hypothetical protein
MTPELFIAVLHDIICPVIILQVSTDKTIHGIGKFLHSYVVFPDCHKTYYNAKTVENLKSYRKLTPQTLSVFPPKGGLNPKHKIIN